MLLLGGCRATQISSVADNAERSQEEIYIPKDLDDCFVQLKKLLKPEETEQLRSGTEDDVNLCHLGFGMWIRNNWGLWRGSRLAKWFNARGVEHPDDMSGIIFHTFWCHLNGKPLRLEERIARSQSYWRMMRYKPKSIIAPDGTKIDFEMSGVWQASNGLWRVYFTGTSDDSHDRLNVELLGDNDVTNCIVHGCDISDVGFQHVLKKLNSSTNATKSFTVVLYSPTSATDRAVPKWTGLCVDSGVTNITLRHTTYWPLRTLEVREEDLSK